MGQVFWVIGISFFIFGVAGLIYTIIMFFKNKK